MFWIQKLLVSLSFLLGSLVTFTGIYFREDIKNQFSMWILSLKGIDVEELSKALEGITSPEQLAAMMAK